MDDPDTRPDAPDVFISYSRKDQARVRRLHDALEAQQRQIWVDWGSIHPSTEWWGEIERGIRAADAFVYVISPDAVGSEVCQRELKLAIRFGKRLVPMVCRDTDLGQIAPELRARDWIFIRDSDDFDAGIERLGQALDIDIDWIHRHTEQLLQSLAWQDGDRDKSRLLKGRALQHAESWLADSTGKDPAPAPVQIEFIQMSRRAAASRMRRWLAGSVTVLIVLLILTAWALYASYVANEARDDAVASRLGAKANLVADEWDALIERSALLAIESWRRRGPSLDNDIALRGALRLLPQPLAGWGHLLQPISDAIFVGDGDLVAYATDRQVHLIRTSAPADGRILDHPSPVAQLVSCGDSGVLIARSKSGGIHFWQIDAARLVVRPPDGRRASLLRCGSDRQLAIGWTDGTVSLHDVANGELRRTLPGTLGSRVRALAFSPDAKHVAAGGDKLLRVWRTAIAGDSGAAVTAMEHRHPVLDIAFDPRGNRVATASDSGAYLWSLPDGELIQRLRHSINVNAVSFDAVGGRLVVASGYSAHVWDADKLRKIGRLRHQGPVTGAAFSSDGATIVTAGNDDSARLWRARDGAELLRFVHQHVGARAGRSRAVITAAFDRAGQRMLTTGADGRVQVWQVSPVGDIRYLGKPRYSNGRRWSRDGRYLVERIAAKTWQLVESLSGRELLRFETGLGVLAFVVDEPSGRLVLSTFSGELRLLSIHDGALLQRMALPQPADALALHPDGNGLVSGSRDGVVRHWSMSDGRLLWAQRHGGLLYAAAVSADGGYVATGSVDRHARVWRSADGALLHSLKHPHDVKDLAFRPDGRMLATACSDSTARIWELASGKVVRYLDHRFPVDVVHYTTDGTRLLTGSTDKSVRIWDAINGVERSRIELRNQIERAGFVGGGLLVVASGRDVGTHLVEDEALVDAACARLTRNLTRIEWAKYLGSETPRATCPKLPLPTM